MRKIKNKKAQGHVEMILSFLIFLGFVLASFAFLNPLKGESIVPRFLEMTEKTILEKVEIEYSVIPMRIKEGVPLNKPCFKISEEDFSDIGDKVIVKDDEGKRGNAVKSGEEVSIRLWDTKIPDFLFLYFSDEFRESSQNCVETLSLGKDEYELGVLRKEKAVFEGKLQELEEKYESDYEGLKDELGITNDFSFSISGDLTWESSEKYKPQKDEVFAKDVLLTVIDKNGGFKSIIMNIQVWE